MPAAQALHASPVYPGWHTQDEEPGTEVVASGQALQSLSWKLPSTVEKVPALQRKLHVPLDRAATETDQRPAVQLVQAELPLRSEYLPAGHSVHSSCPVPAACLPVWQWTQPDTVDLVPTGQS